MKHNQLLLISFLLLTIPGSAGAQAWSGIINPPRAIDWSTAGVPGGIPNRTTACATIAPYTGSAATINSAISACSEGQVVSLQAGTFNLSSGIDFAGKNNVTLRGSGPNQTFLIFTNGSGCTGIGADVCIQNGDTNDCGGCGSPANASNWTAGYSRGTTTITLSTNITGPTKPAVGQMIFLDQLDDSLTDTGQIWTCQTAGTCSQQNGVSNGRPGRALTQVVKITAISGTGPYTVTISPALYMPNWNACTKSGGCAPQAWWSSNLPVTGVGIENLSMDHTNTGLTQMAAAGVAIFNGYGNWISNVRDITSPHEHVMMYQTARTTIQNSYFFGSKNATSQSYGTDTYTGSDNLVINNIYQHIATGLINEGCQGCVHAYNLAIDDWYTAGGGTWQQGAFYHHSVGDAYLLWEGNQGPMFVADDIHGSSHFFTLFRNRFIGLDDACNCKTNQTTPLILEAYNRYYNIIGNVLGMSGMHTNYQVAPASTTDTGSATTTNRSVYSFGYSGNQGTYQSPIPNDTTLVSTLMRWGNYDSSNAAVRFVNAEVPSGISSYANAVPSSQILPESFFLAAKPTWWSTPWGTPAWPANGPDVAGGNIANVGGHANNIPAALCYLNSPIDTNYPGAADRGVLLFNAKTCYGTQSVSIAPPSSLTAIVQ